MDEWISRNQRERVHAGWRPPNSYCLRPTERRTMSVQHDKWPWSSRDRWIVGRLLVYKRLHLSASEEVYVSPRHHVYVVRFNNERRWSVNVNVFFIGLHRSAWTTEAPPGNDKRVDRNRRRSRRTKYKNDMKRTAALRRNENPTLQRSVTPLETRSLEADEKGWRRVLLAILVRAMWLLFPVIFLNAADSSSQTAWRDPLASRTRLGNVHIILKTSPHDFSRDPPQGVAVMQVFSFSRWSLNLVRSSDDCLF